MSQFCHKNESLEDSRNVKIRNIISSIFLYWCSKTFSSYIVGGSRSLKIILNQSQLCNYFPLDGNHFMGGAEQAREVAACGE